MRSGTLRLFFLLAVLIGLISCAGQTKSQGGGADTRAGEGAEIVKSDYIRQIVKSRLSRISACYEGAIDKRPGAMGKARVSWDIDEEGDVKNAKLVEVDPSLTDIEECLIHEVSELHFDRSQLFQENATATDVVEVSYPFYFDERQSFTPDKLNPGYRNPAPSIAPPIQDPTGK